MSIKPKFLVVWGDGINCENETAFAIEKAEGQAIKVHISDLLKKSEMLQEADALVFPGGFSFGDHLGSGQITALKIEKNLKDTLQEFVKTKPVLGVCNGFQILVRLGLLPDADFQKTCALVANRQGHFIDQWVSLETEKTSPCIWTKDLPAKFVLPMRHGEGRFVSKPDVISRLKEQKQIPLSYTEDVNGAMENIAAVCDSSGLVMGIMPHPEAAIEDWQLPFAGIAYGLDFFKNAVSYIRSQR